MAEPDLILLQHMVQRVLDNQALQARDLADIRERLSAIEFSQSSTIRHLGALAETDARMQAGLDRMRDDIARIQRRLDIADPPPPN